MPRRSGEEKMENEYFTTSKLRESFFALLNLDKEKVALKVEKTKSRAINEEIKLSEVLIENLLAEFASDSFPSFFSDLIKVIEAEPDLYESIFDNDGFFWLMNRLLVLWDIFENKNIEINNIELVKLPLNSDKFDGKVIFQFYLNNTVDEIKELIINTMPKNFKKFNENFEKEILKKRVSFMLHQADLKEDEK